MSGSQQERPIVKLLRFVEANKNRHCEYTNHRDFPDYELEQAIAKVERLYDKYDKERNLRRRLAADVVRLRGVGK